jgi:hypothetical protein
VSIALCSDYSKLNKETRARLAIHESRTKLDTATSFPAIAFLCLSGLPVVIGRVSRDVVELQDSLQVRHRPCSLCA